MLRKVLLGSLAVGLVVSGMLLCKGQAGSPRAAEQANPTTALAPYVHTVIFHLKKDAPEGQAQALIADAHELLGKIPSVRGLRIGRPADKATPDLAKKDFQVGLLVLFDDYEGLKTYLDHPLHLKYVEKHLKHIELEKLLVFDFVNQRK